MYITLIFFNVQYGVQSSGSCVYITVGSFYQILPMIDKYIIYCNVLTGAGDKFEKNEMDRASVEQTPKYFL
jgi:hypothetical protein